MYEFAVGLFRFADYERREIKGYILVIVAHFLALIVGQALIQFCHQTWMSWVNGVFGIAMEVGAIIWLFARVGLPLDVILGGFVLTDNETCELVTRVLVGFFTVESFVNICFMILPFHANPGAFALVAVSAGSYFLFRFMNRDSISWNLVWFPAANIALGIISCIISAAQTQWLSL